MSAPGESVVSPPAIGEILTVDVGGVAHGGHCVARREGDGFVLFVRHSLPGERVRAKVTEIGSGGRFARADAVEVLRASAGRVPAPCPYAGPGLCGGCDWQHASLDEQRRLKTQVVTEQLERLGGLTAEEIDALGLVTEPVPGDVEGMRWRTRVEFAVAPGPDRLPGLRVHRSHEVVPLEDCLIASHGVVDAGVLGAPVPQGVEALDVVDPGTGEAVVVPLGHPEGRGGGRGRGRHQGHRGARGGQGRARPRGPQPLGPVPGVTESVGTHQFTLSARGFWQVHPGAAQTFTDQVLEWLAPQPGERALDLYSGVGLFAVPLAERVGLTGSVVAVEADREATAAAERHLTPYPWARAVAAPTERALDDLVRAGERADVVVLDPPRTGAGRAVVEALAALQPRAVVYVACDPAALARDVATAREAGLRLAGLRVLDAFPMTHHVECIALLLPAAAHEPPRP